MMTAAAAASKPRASNQVAYNEQWAHGYVDRGDKLHPRRWHLPAFVRRHLTVTVGVVTVFLGAAVLGALLVFAPKSLRRRKTTAEGQAGCPCPPPAVCTDVGDGVSTATAQCAQCTKSTDCSGQQVCFATVCRVACTTSLDCPLDARVCDNGACLACSRDQDCNNTPDTPFCVQGECVQCRSGADCGTEFACRPETHACALRCNYQASTQTTAGVSVMCPGGEVCDTDTNLCVACLSNADCGDAAQPLCDTRKHTCVACLADGDCRHKGQNPGAVCDVTTNTCHTPRCLYPGPSGTHAFQLRSTADDQGNALCATQGECSGEAGVLAPPDASCLTWQPCDQSYTQGTNQAFMLQAPPQGSAASTSSYARALLVDVDGNPALLPFHANGSAHSTSLYPVNAVYFKKATDYPPAHFEIVPLTTGATASAGNAGFVLRAVSTLSGEQAYLAGSTAVGAEARWAACPDGESTCDPPVASGMVVEWTGSAGTCVYPSS